MTPHAFLAVFLVALSLMLATRLWLSARQVAHVRAHRGDVPAAFASRIGIAAHQKAADYTVARQGLGRVETVVDVALLLLLTLGGGLAALQTLTGRLAVSPLWQDVLLTGALALVSGAVALPFSWWSTFVIEERFGFNRMTLKLWLADLVKGTLVGIALGLPLLLLVLWLMREAGPWW